MRQIIREIPNNYHTFALFDFPKMGNLIWLEKFRVFPELSQNLYQISQMLHATAIVAYFWLILMKHVGKSSDSEYIDGAYWGTPWKINMETTNRPFGKENDLNQTSMIIFQM